MAIILDIFLILAIVFGVSAEFIFAIIPMFNSASTINLFFGIAIGLLSLCLAIMAIVRFTKDIIKKYKHYKRKNRW